MKPGTRVLYMSTSPARLTAGVFVGYTMSGRLVILTKRGEWHCSPQNVYERTDTKRILTELIYRKNKAKRRLESDNE